MSLHDRTTSIESFLAAASDKQPTPGGGAVAGLAGALAASMGEMVIRYSVGKKNLVAHAAAHEEALREFSRARLLLLRLMEEDQLAFAALTAAKKLPDDAPDKQATRDATVVAALRVPQAIAAAGLAILRLALSLADKSNPWLLSDLAVCGELATATVRCGLHNVRANLPELSEADRVVVERECDEMLAEAIDVVKELMPAIARARG